MANGLKGFYIALGNSRRDAEMVSEIGNILGISLGFSSSQLVIQVSDVELHLELVLEFNENTEQAKNYESLLQVNDVPVVVQEQEDQLGNREIAVMVPEESLDEAHVIIESQDAYDDFYDFALEDEDESDFDSDVFEDDF